MFGALPRSGYATIAGAMICMAASVALAPQSHAQQSQTVEFAAPALADPLMVRADAQARSILAARGYAIVPQAPLRIELAWSRRPNDVAMKPNGDTKTPHGSAKPVKRRFDLCKDQIHRLVVAMIDTQSGEVRYRGSAELNRCRAPSGEEVNLMVRQSLAGLG